MRTKVFYTIMNAEVSWGEKNAAIKTKKLSFQLLRYKIQNLNITYF